MISIVIPVYEMHGRGIEFLDELITSIEKQLYKDWEIIVSDNSEDTGIHDYLWINRSDLFAQKRLRYLRNPGSNPVQNLNNAINQASGDIIKPMFQDDKFHYVITLQLVNEILKIWPWIVFTSNNFGGNDWVHNPFAFENNKLLLEGKNPYGSPSAIAYRKCDLRFDENLIWLMDCEFYCRMHAHYGDPFISDVKIDIRQWPGQMTETIAAGNIRLVEQQYCFNKHAIV